MDAPDVVAPTTVFAAIAEQAPAFAGAFRELFRVASTGTTDALDERTRTLIYLAVLAAQGADESFAVHLRDAERLGIAKATVLEAVLTAVPAVGITPILRAIRPLLRA
jgi:alkylhydroperoxidase/carboxymuconolactone decarboxylase family protein YurZ